MSHNLSIPRAEWLLYRRLGGRINAVDPNREIGFGFVSCSCRACVRACEAVRVREGSVASTLEARLARSPPAAAPAWVSAFPFVLLYARVLSIIFDFEAASQGFWWKSLNCVGMRKGFRHVFNVWSTLTSVLNKFINIWWYTQGFLVFLFNFEAHSQGF